MMIIVNILMKMATIIIKMCERVLFGDDGDDGRPAKMSKSKCSSFLDIEGDIQQPGSDPIINRKTKPPELAEMGKAI